jgi:hypothetical protein
MRANVISTVQRIPVKLISDPKQVLAAETGQLMIGKKPALIVRGLHT